MRNPLPLIALALLLPGCYAYTPTRLDSVPVGASVRAHLSPEAHTLLVDSVGAAERSLVGEVLQRDPGSLLLLVPWAQSAEAPVQGAVHQRLRFRESDLVGIELRRLDRARTGIVAAAVGGAVLFAVQRMFEGETGEKGTNPPPPGPGQYRGR